jgi:mono/diheme cytochrome c family protein
MRRAALLVVAACGAAPPMPTVPVVAIDPAPGPALGDARAVVEASGGLYVFDAGGVRVIAGGAIAGAAARAWRSAALASSPDGDGAWVLGVDGDGRVLHVGDGAAIEDVGDRYGVAGAGVTAIAAGGGAIAVALARGVAWTERAHGGGPALAIDATAPAYRALAAAADRFAGVRDGAVDVWEPAAGRVRTFAVPGARAAAFVGDRLAVATDAALLVEDARGRLAPRPVPAPPTAIAASGARLWIAAGGALYALDGDRLARATGVAAPPDVRLFPSARGVWMAGGGALVRVELDTPGDRDERAWARTIAPVVGRVCARCHLPGGSAGVDLSTYAAWVAHAAPLRHRVLDTDTMPPPGTILSDADRAAIRAWLDAVTQESASPGAVGVTRRR